MRKIQFNDETILEIRSFIESGHSIKETSNKFTIKPDTLRRVMFENDIKPFYTDKRIVYKDITPEYVAWVCNLYRNTNIKMKDIVDEVKLPYYKVKHIIEENFPESFINSRKSKLYHNSKLGSKNPYYGKFKLNHSKYKGILDDGNGYYMMLKPEWYTGRKNSKYVFCHSVILAEHLGLTEIPKGYVVHHIDLDKHNNDISNLALMTISGHAKLHQMLNRICKGAETIPFGSRDDNSEMPDNS